MARYYGKRKRRGMPRGMASAMRQQRYAISKMDPKSRASQYGYTFRQRLLDPSLDAMTPAQRVQRQLTGYRGDGDYWSDFKKGGWFGKSKGMGQAIRKLGGLAGGMLGGNSSIGRNIGADLSKWVGFGDYGPPTTNQLMAGGDGVPNAMTVNASDDLTGDVYVSHTEYVGLVNAGFPAGPVQQPGTPTPFLQNSIALNPGISEGFPFLSQLAQNFEMYEFMGLAFQYKPLYGEGAGTSNLLGKVIMATNYDPTAPPFQSSQQMQNYDYACSTKPSTALIHGVETANSQQFGNLQYIRTSNDVSKNPIFTDIGIFSVATEGIATPAVTTLNVPYFFPIGELWVTYRIKLSRSKLVTNTIANASFFDNQVITKQSDTVFTAVTSSASDGIWKATSTTATTMTFSATGFMGRTFMVTVYLNTKASALQALNVSAPSAIGAMGTYNNATNTNLMGLTTSVNPTTSQIQGAAAIATENSAMTRFLIDCNPNVSGAVYSFTLSWTNALVANNDVISITIAQVPSPTAGTTNYEAWNPIVV